MTEAKLNLCRSCKYHWWVGVSDDGVYHYCYKDTKEKKQIAKILNTNSFFPKKETIYEEKFQAPNDCPYVLEHALI